MNGLNFMLEEARKKGKGFSGKPFPSESGVEVVQLTVEQGGELLPHKTPVDVIFYVLGGKGRIVIGEETSDVFEGWILDSPAEIPHAVINTGTGPFTLLVIKLFSRKDAG